MQSRLPLVPGEEEIDEGNLSLGLDGRAIEDYSAPEIDHVASLVSEVALLVDSATFVVNIVSATVRFQKQREALSVGLA